jgi:predicted nucleic acid-binding protein
MEFSMSTVFPCEDAVTAARKRLYLDVCTYCRPYDEQSLLPIRLETDAYYLIVNHVEQGRYTLVVSPVHFAEVADTEDVRQRVEVQQLLERFRSSLRYSVAEIRARAEELVRRKFGVADAAHVAFAEATADVFITCDRDLVKRCRAHTVRVEVLNPLEFVAREGIS